jgi:hypothetical protein
MQSSAAPSTDVSLMEKRPRNEALMYIAAKPRAGRNRIKAGARLYAAEAFRLRSFVVRGWAIRR